MITITNISKAYAATPVLEGCSLQVPDGAIYALAGRNGAGKSTLLKLAAGFLCPDTGEIRVQGKQTWENRESIQKDIGTLIDVPVFYEHLSAAENLKLQQAYQKTDTDIGGILEKVGLSGISEKPVSAFSTGMRQRLAIARALLHNPRVLLLDEPLNGLDPLGAEELRSLFVSLAEEGKTLLISSHILSDISAMADTVGILSGHRICREFDMEQYRGSRKEAFEQEVIAAMKLIRLEWKKINPAPYLGTALGLLALSMLIALLFCFLPESEWGPAQMSLSRNWHFLILLVSCVTLFSYTMLGAVLSSRVILTEFLGKNKLLVFSWPISRKRLFAAKTAFLFLFTIAGTFISNLLAVLTTLLLSNLFHGFPGAFTADDLGYLLLVSFSIALLASCICLAAVRFGFWKKSPTAVIVSALILIAPMTNMASANLYGGLSLIVFTLIMAVAFLFVYGNLSKKIVSMEAL